MRSGWIARTGSSGSRRWKADPRQLPVGAKDTPGGGQAGFLRRPAATSRRGSCTRWRGPASGSSSVHGSITGTPSPAKSRPLRVTIVRSWLAAVAARRLSTAGSGRRAAASMRPHRSATRASIASTRPEKNAGRSLSSQSSSAAPPVRQDLDAFAQFTEREHAEVQHRRRAGVDPLNDAPLRCLAAQLRQHVGVDQVAQGVAVSELRRVRARPRGRGRDRAEIPDRPARAAATRA